MAGGFSASVSGAASPAAAATPAPTAWVAKWSQKKSAVYYVNTLTGRSQWTAPAELLGESSGGEEARQSALLRSLRSPSGAATPASPWGSASGGGGGVLGSASGAGAGGGVRGTEWEERASKKYPGRSFYINAASGERAWELPEGHTLV